MFRKLPLLKHCAKEQKKEVERYEKEIFRSNGTRIILCNGTDRFVPAAANRQRPQPQQQPTLPRQQLKQQQPQQQPRVVMPRS